MRIAIVGTNIGCTLHVRALRGAGFEVVALVGRDVSKTRARAAHFGIPIATDTLDAVLADVDAVVIASPPATHHDLVMRAIGAGKHVLCEKPFALDLEQARAMRDAAKAAGVVGHINYELRWFADFAVVRDHLRSGTIGSLFQANISFDHGLVSRGLEGLPAWWLEADQGGGWLRNYASHGIDLVRYLAGDFSAVAALVHHDVSRPMSADDGYSILFQLADGAQGVLSGSCRAWDFWDMSRLICERGTIAYGAHGVSLATAEGQGAVAVLDAVRRSLWVDDVAPPPPSGELLSAKSEYDATHSSDHGFAEQVCLSRAFRARILDQSYTHPSIATFDDGVAHMAVIDAVRASAAARDWVEVE